MLIVGQRSSHDRLSQSLPLVDICTHHHYPVSMFTDIIRWSPKGLLGNLLRLRNGIITGRMCFLVPNHRYYSIEGFGQYWWITNLFLQYVNDVKLEARHSIELQIHGGHSSSFNKFLHFVTL